MSYDELMAFIESLPRSPRGAPPAIKLTWWQWAWVKAMAPAGVAGHPSIWGVPVELVADVEESTPITEKWSGTSWSVE